MVSPSTFLPATTFNVLYYASPPGTPEWSTPKPPRSAAPHRCGSRVPEKGCEEKKARLYPSFLHLSTVQVRSPFDLEIPMLLAFMAVDDNTLPTKPII
jgi:hypothetical protein